MFKKFILIYNAAFFSVKFSENC